MKTQSIHWLIALAACVSASAQPPKPPGDRRPPPPPPFFMVLDADQDKELSAEEIAAASEILAKMDKNGDGKITLDEVRRPDGEGGRPKGPGGPPPGDRPVPPLIKALDTDADGTLSAEELAAAPESLKTLDKNGDGELSPEEIHPRPPRPDGPPPRDGPPEGAPEDAPEVE